MARAKTATDVRNRTARHEFATGDTITAGVVLSGNQVKQIRAGQIDLTGAYVKISSNDKGQLEAWAHAVTVGSESQATLKLLLTKTQISHLAGLSQRKKATLVVTRGHFVHGYFKLDLAPGKRLLKHDRRDQLRAADLQRDAEREL